MGFIILLFVLAVLCWTFLIGYHLGNSRGKTLGVKKQDYLFERKKNGIAMRALREVANDSGNPILSAQIALDVIEQAEYKQLEN